LGLFEGRLGLFEGRLGLFEGRLIGGGSLDGALRAAALLDRALRGGGEGFLPGEWNRACD
jgi:hypothetical protein